MQLRSSVIALLYKCVVTVLSSYRPRSYCPYVHVSCGVSIAVHILVILANPSEASGIQYCERLLMLIVCAVFPVRVWIGLHV